ncbi:MAG TPA: energy transducer TonB [Chitinivibrionales bacterium]|nr:energy transducer TonB [Chitinivibrionales bacterium]
MVASAAAVLPRVSSKADEDSFAPVVVISAIFHAVILIGIPLLATLFYHSEKYERPKTFTLVSMPKTAIQQKIAQAVKKPKTANPIPAKKKSKQASKKEENTKENTDQLEELLDAIPASVSEITAGQSFKYAWYINSVISKVEENWKPPSGITQKKDAAVTVFFTIFPGGDISPVVVKESSGISTLDNLAVRAVTMAAPFGKLPPGWSGNRLDLKYILHCVKQ